MRSLRLFVLGQIDENLQHVHGLAWLCWHFFMHHAATRRCPVQATGLNQIAIAQ
ncbi:hypothetical protein D3C76_1626380 [compost metagenome]